MKGRMCLAVVTCAIVWAAVIISAATVLEGTSGFARVLLILGGGASATIILLGGLATQEKKGQ